MIFISNFNSARKLADIEDYFNKYRGHKYNFLIDGIHNGIARWSVPKKATPGDIIIFMCAKEARHNIGMATSHIPLEHGKEFRTFVEEQKKLYKEYSGFIMAYGEVDTLPEEDEGWWMSDIRKLIAFDQPVYIDEFRNFISISRTNSITYLNDDQWERLKWIIHQHNQEMFQSSNAPDAQILAKEFEDSVRKASEKSLEQLKRLIKRSAVEVTASVVQTKVYHRDPHVAAYVKKRAKGFCQLCGMQAPFADQNGEPYLECHHLQWLSDGGHDSIDNCVALCPNCHRKMHAINNPSDVSLLKEKASEEQVY